MLRLTDKSGFSASKSIVYLGKRTGIAVGSASTGVTLDITTLTGGDLGNNPTLVEDDFVIAYHCFNASVDQNVTWVTSGYTQRIEGYADSTEDTNIAVFYKFMGATPDTTAVSGHSYHADNAQAAGCRVFRGVDKTTPFDVADQGNSGTNTVLFDPPSITPATPGAVIVVVGAGAHTQGAVGFSQAATGDQLEDFVGGASNDINDTCFAHGHKRWAGGGVAFNPDAWTFGGTDSSAFSNRGFAFALRPKR